MQIDLNDKVIVVTGSSRGIGQELVRRFAQEGAQVVINYFHSEDCAKQLYDEVSEYSKCLLIKADVTDKGSVDQLYKATMDTFGRVDVLVNNAGICDDNRINLMKEEQWHKVIETNLTGTFFASSAFSKAMIRQKRGKIINIASLKGKEGYEGQANYVAAKAGIIGMTKTIARELGHFGIAVNALCPGFIVTDLNRHNESKKIIAQRRSVLDYTTALNDLVNFTVLLSSDCINGISGRCFYLDSRIN